MVSTTQRLLILTTALVAVWAFASPAAIAQDESNLEQAEKAYDKKQWDKAIHLYTLAIDGETLDKDELKFAYTLRGMAWGEKGQYDLAIADNNRAIELDPKYAYAYRCRGGAWCAKKDFDKALADYNRAIELAPKDSDSYCGRGLVWSSKEQYDKALADYTRAIELEPKDAYAYAFRASAWMFKRDYDKALVDCSRAIKLDPKNAIFYQLRGNVWQRKKKYDKAIIAFNCAIKLNPKDGYAYGFRGRVRCVKQEYDQAIADFNRAIKLAPKGAAGYWFRGRLHFTQGKFDKAIVDLQHCVTLEPDAKYATIWLYLARGRTKQSADKDLAAFVSKYVKDRSVWPGPVFEMFAGRIDAAKCLKAAELKKGDLSKTAHEALRSEQLCQAYFYIAQYELINGRKDKARALLEKCLATKATDFIEYTAAIAELKRMKAKAK